MSAFCPWVALVLIGPDLSYLMSEKYIPICPPVLAADCEDRLTEDQQVIPGWASRVRAAIGPDKDHVRPGADLSIEGRTVAGLWQRILLPGGGTQFVSAADRDAVLAKILL